MISKNNCLKIYSLAIIVLLLASCGGSENNTPAVIVIDQKYEHNNSVGYLAPSVYYYMPQGQEFVPSKPYLVGVDLMFSSNSATSNTITVNIRKGNLQNPILATSTMNVDAAKAWSHFVFSAINVVPGDTYIIEVTSDDASAADALAWWGDDVEGGYPYGQWINNGTVKSGTDMFFRTYAYQ